MPLSREKLRHNHKLISIVVNYMIYQHLCYPEQIYALTLPSKNKSQAAKHNFKIITNG